MGKTPTAADAPEWHRDEHGRCSCGMCGGWFKPFRLVDVRQHLVKGLRPFAFICDGCVARLIRPGRRVDGKPMKKSVFIRGLPGSKATQLAHVKREQARHKPELEYRP